MENEEGYGKHFLTSVFEEISDQELINEVINYFSRETTKVNDRLSKAYKTVLIGRKLATQDQADFLAKTLVDRARSEAAKERLEYHKVINQK